MLITLYFIQAGENILLIQLFPIHFTAFPRKMTKQEAIQQAEYFSYCLE